MNTVTKRIVYAQYVWQASFCACEDVSLTIVKPKTTPTLTLKPRFGEIVRPSELRGSVFDQRAPQQRGGILPITRRGCNKSRGNHVTPRLLVPHPNSQNA